MRTLFIACFVMFMTVSASAQLQYIDLFDSDQGYTVDSTIGDVPGEYAGLYDGTYKVRIHETVPYVIQMAYSPVFSTRGENDPYEVLFDIKFPEMSASMPMWAIFAMEGQSNVSGLKYTLSWPQAHLSVCDHSGNTHYAHGIEQGRWYTVLTRGNNADGFANILIMDRESGDIKLDLVDAPLVPGAFNQFALGAETAHGEGEWGTIMVDNIYLSGPVANDAQSWGGVKALYR